jgi:hypothetical protein
MSSLLKQRSFLKTLRLAAAVSWALSAAHARAADMSQFVPVVFTHFESQMPDAKAAVIAESFSRRLQAAIVDVYATETLGSASKLSPPLELAVLSSAGYALGEMDRAIETSVMPDIRPTLASLAPGETMVFSVEILWADRATADTLPQVALVNETVMAALKLSGRTDIAGLLSMRWVDADQFDSAGHIRQSLRTAEHLGRMRVASYNQWLPWDSRVDFAIDRKGVNLSVDALTLPARIQDLKQRKQSGLLVERIIYDPMMHPDYAVDLADFVFHRFYSASGRSNDGTLRVSFGEWRDEQFVSCAGSNCLKAINRVPTIHGVIQFSENSWWDSVVGWFRSWFVRQVEVRILLKDLLLSFDRDTHQLRVLPDRSQIPIAIRKTSLFGNESSYLLDQRAGVFGVNFYETFVGTQITDGLSADLNRTLAAADKSLSDFIAQIAASFVR